MQPEEKGTIKDLVLYRLDTAKSDIRAAKVLFGIEEYKGANNRAYFQLGPLKKTYTAKQCRSFCFPG